MTNCASPGSFTKLGRSALKLPIRAWTAPRLLSSNPPASILLVQGVCGPDGPGGPGGPVGPVGPVWPVAPVGPAEPVAPVAPVGPVGPSGPAGPVAPVVPVGPGGPADPAGPVILPTSTQSLPPHTCKWPVSLMIHAS